MEIITSNVSRTSYPVGTDIKKAYNSAVASAKKFLSIEEFTSRPIQIFCTGSSGAILAALFAQKLSFAKVDVEIIYIKKEGETTHSTRPIKITDNSVIVIIDDFISTGATLNRIYSHIPYSEIAPHAEREVDWLHVEILGGELDNDLIKLKFKFKYLFTTGR